MPDAARGACLRQEAPHRPAVARERAAHQLDRDAPPDQGVLRLEHAAHRAGTELREHAVRADDAAGARVVDLGDQALAVVLADLVERRLKRAARETALER